MATVKVYNEKGEATSDVTLTPVIFEVTVNPEVIHQVVVAMQANKRRNLAHTKTRAAVRGGGRKPWRQKGTGRARHGSSRSPIWIGGGVTFGPSKEQNFSKKINKKMRKKALFMALTDRVGSDAMKVVDVLPSGEFKTKNVATFLKTLNLEKSVLIVTDRFTKELVKSVSNLPQVDIIEARNLNVLDVINYKYLVASSAAVKQIETVFLGNVAK